MMTNYFYTIWDDFSMCNEHTVQKLLPCVSIQRREQALTYHHVFGQFCCLQSYILLVELLRKHHYLNPSSPIPVFEYNRYGKPFLRNGPYFSISHCKQAILVAIAPVEIGVDIESDRPINTNLTDFTMNANEQNNILNSANPTQTFLSYWTRKEAYLKWKGTGIIHDLKEVLFHTQGVEIMSIVPNKKSYCYSICKTQL